MHHQAGKTIPSFVVMVGGTALSAHEIRLEAEDIDFFAAELDFEVLETVEKRLKMKFGDTFKLDVTSAENIRGEILIRDISESKTIKNVRVGDNTVSIKVLAVKDLFLLEMNTGRDNDKADLDLLAPKVDLGRLIERFARYLGWYPDRHHVVSYVDRFVCATASRSGMDEKSFIEKLTIPFHVREALMEARNPTYE